MPDSPDGSESHADVVCAVNRDEIHKGQPVVRVEGGQLVWQDFEGFCEGFNGGTLRLRFLNLRHDRFQPSLRFFKVLAQAIKAFFVLGLVGQGQYGHCRKCIATPYRKQPVFLPVSHPVPAPRWWYPTGRPALFGHIQEHCLW